MKNRVTQAANSFSANFSDRIIERSMNIDPEHSETLGLHGVNCRKDPVTNALAVLIYQTISYQFDRVERVQKIIRPPRAWKYLHKSYESKYPGARGEARLK